MIDPIFEAREMQNLDAENQAHKALAHLIAQLRDRPFLAYYIGPGSQTWALVTEAYATISSQDLVDVRKRAVNLKARDPRDGYSDLLEACRRVVREQRDGAEVGVEEVSTGAVNACIEAVKAAEGGKRGR